MMSDIIALKTKIVKPSVVKRRSTLIIWTNPMSSTAYASSNKGLAPSTIEALYSQGFVRDGDRITTSDPSDPWRMYHDGCVAVCVTHIDTTWRHGGTYANMFRSRLRPPVIMQLYQKKNPKHTMADMTHIIAELEPGRIVDLTPYRGIASNSNKDVSADDEMRVAADMLVIFGEGRLRDYMRKDIVSAYTEVTRSVIFTFVYEFRNLLNLVKPTPEEVLAVIDVFQKVPHQKRMTPMPVDDTLVEALPRKTFDFIVKHKRWPITPVEALRGEPLRIRIERFGVTIPVGERCIVEGVGPVYVPPSYTDNNQAPLYFSEDMDPNQEPALINFKETPKGASVVGEFDRMPSCVKTLSDVKRYVTIYESSAENLKRFIETLTNKVPAISLNSLETIVKSLRNEPLLVKGAPPIGISINNSKRVIYIQQVQGRTGSQTYPVQIPFGGPVNELVGRLVTSGLSSQEPAKKPSVRGMSR